ncbi:hypothetical protein MSG28_013403 [Choristoneura fumiferana]|uniref:Uncharacterized protein n=1 Tax=Choristoneura fumiferana TaxID=7141 RepID=A0ACC0KTM6_CHOFU|nr:hypothetical protein MSG28_013403 [Choristoneura fumiferana]
MLRALLLSGAALLALGHDEYHRPRGEGAAAEVAARELEPEYWAAEAFEGIARRLRDGANERVADRVVMFLGDGLSVPTLAAARALRGQRQGRSGEEEQLAYERFPVTGLAKTYCTDAQIADSACSATAYLCGAKGNRGPSASARACGAGTAAPPAPNITCTPSPPGRWPTAATSVGIVTTTRVTHASPAGAYAHTAARDWESDADLLADCGHADPAARQADIAMQLMNSYPGNNFKVILGGGRREFRPNTTIDEEGASGRRLDGRDLIEEWRARRAAAGVSHAYVWNRTELLRAVEDPPEYLLGLFGASHMRYEAEARAAGADEPAGRDDGGGHRAFPRLALLETIALSDAVERADALLPRDARS